jgi:hypothetical protein
VLQVFAYLRPDEMQRYTYSPLEHLRRRAVIFIGE